MSVVNFPRRPLPSQIDLLCRTAPPATVLRLVPRYLNICVKRVEREALKIAAGVHTASVFNVMRDVENWLSKFGPTQEELLEQQREVAEFLAERLTMYREITGLESVKEVRIGTR